MSGPRVHPASFRDPSGFVFEHEGRLFRHVAQRYAADYDALIGSGLYAELSEAGLLVSHRECSDQPSPAADAYRVIEPARIPFVSHPYEWCFGQLRDAARTTLEIQQRALARGLSLKDASAYNVQLRAGKPVFIDSLSFERYLPGRPWVAYRQFCEHFLAPLALMALRDVRLGALLRVHLDGIPLDLAASLLPLRARLRPHLLIHLFLHARFQRRYAGERSQAARPLSPEALRNLIASLDAAIESLRWDPGQTTWSHYYDGDSYTPRGAGHKRALVAKHLDAIRAQRVVDLGANTGEMTRLATERGALALAFDADSACVERAWQRARGGREPLLLPLCLDLANPSPAQGFAHREREAWLARSRCDVLLALALVHHLAIGNNLPLTQIAELFAAIAPEAIVEFVPKSDAKVQQLLASREDIFADYDRAGFEKAFARYFELVEASAIEESERVLYRFRRR
jgi:SAM-dependent methyltransferase